MAVAHGGGGGSRWWLVLLAFLITLQLHGTSKPIALPTLGRPFELGDLYNLKDDNIVLGPKLWSSDHLANFSQHITRRTKFEVMASEDIQDLKNYFDINGWLALSFMGGLIKVSGSAGYLDDRVKKSNVARVSLKFDTRTFTRELKPELFLKVDYENVLDKVSYATHVVVGIEYGASAVFVFDREVHAGETKRTVTGGMQASIKSLPGLSTIGGGGGTEIKISEEEKKKTEKFTCRFHGDFVLKRHPGTYLEAIEVYKELPSYLGDNYENSVPMTAWLYPLDALPIEKANEILHDVKNSLIHEAGLQFEDLNAMRVMSNDILESELAEYHERVRKNVETFKSNVRLFTLLLKQQMTIILPDIRSSGNATSLVKLLSDTESSPFGKSSLNAWMAEAKQEFFVLQTTHSLPNYCRHEGDFNALLLSNKEYTFALTMRLDDGRDDFLEDMSRYLAETKRTSAFKPHLGKGNPWWTDHSLISDLQRKGSAFANFYRLEKQKEEGDILKSNVQFLVREIGLASGARGITVELYKYAALVDADFHIPSAAGVPQKIATSYRSITIAWDEPESGADNIDFYQVETYVLENTKETNEKNGTDSKNSLSKVGTNRTEGKREKMTVSDLKPQSTYAFVVNTISTLGKTAASKQSNFIRTAPCPRGTYYSKSNERCFDCDPGYYSESAGSTSCRKCPIGTRSDSGSYACEKCPEGTYSFDAQCLPCDPGEYVKVPGSTSCRKCPVGTFSDGFGSVRCEKCPQNTTTVTTGARDVTECGGDLDAKIDTVFARIVDGLNAKDASLQTQMVAVESRIEQTFGSYHPERDGRYKLVQNHDFRVEAKFGKFAVGKWQDYKNGFGIPFSPEYWIGLDELHRLTGAGKWNLIFQVVWDKNQVQPRVDPRAGSVGRLELRDFAVASEENHFRLRVGSMVEKENWGELTESQANDRYSSQLNGRRFSTQDSDQDESSYHCAEIWRGGWWFSKSCGNLCPNCGLLVLTDGRWRKPASSSMWLKKVD